VALNVSIGTVMGAVGISSPPLLLDELWPVTIAQIAPVVPLSSDGAAIDLPSDRPAREADVNGPFPVVCREPGTRQMG